MTSAKLYDVRYSRYSGPREPRWRSVVALARSSASRAIGLRRTTGAKVWPFLLITVAHLPVVAALGVPLLFEGAPDPLDLLSYSQVLVTITPVIIAFAATTLPSLLTRERRDRVLSLYFSTAVSAAEYLVGKVLAALWLMSLVTLSPLLVLLVGSVLTSDEPMDALREQAADLPSVVLAGVVVALYFAALGLLAGSLTSKRVFAVGGLLGVLLVTPVVSVVVANLSGETTVLAADLSTVALRAASEVLSESAFDADDSAPAALVWAVWSGALLLSAAVLAYRYTSDQEAS